MCNSTLDLFPVIRFSLSYLDFLREQILVVPAKMSIDGHFSCALVASIVLPLMNSMTNGKQRRLTNDVIRHMIWFFLSFLLSSLLGGNGSINVASFFPCPRLIKSCQRTRRSSIFIHRQTFCFVNASFEKFKA
jgi:hypothetical protein